MNLLLATIAVLLVMIILVGFRAARRQDADAPMTVRNPDFTLADACRLAKDEQLDIDAGLRQGLDAFESGLQGLSGAAALTATRKRIMECVDERVMQEEILELGDDIKQGLRQASSDFPQSDPEARERIARHAIEIRILRLFAGGRFEDAQAFDWLAVYEKAAGMRRKALRSYLERAVTGETLDAEEARQQAISMVDGQLRARLLQLPAGARFEQLAREAAEESTDSEKEPSA
ncbi:MAG: hypothetical protein R3217_05370 [Gammaproteobacteria bacterium]|nr:hypothetical protein [Gammaproteobacteria bacterium]